MEDGAGFVGFINGHTDKAITLDIHIPSASFDGGQEKAFDFFVVWDGCNNLPDGQKPSSAFCTGTEYNISKTASGVSRLVKDADGWRVRGRFKVVDAGGPLQGLMAVRLEPLT